MDRLYRFAWRLCSRREDAEDLVQDLLLKLFPRFDELKGLDKPGPWMARVMYRMYIDNHRRYQRSPIRYDHELSLAGDIDGDYEPGLDGLLHTSHETLEQAAYLDQVQKAVAELGEEHRIIFILADVEGYSLAEMQAVLEVPVGTLKSRLHRARKRLVELLDAGAGRGQALPQAPSDHKKLS